MGHFNDSSVVHVTLKARLRVRQLNSKKQNQAHGAKSQFPAGRHTTSLQATDLHAFPFEERTVSDRAQPVNRPKEGADAARHPVWRPARYMEASFSCVVVSRRIMGDYFHPVPPGRAPAVRRRVGGRSNWSTASRPFRRMSGIGGAHGVDFIVSPVSKCEGPGAPMSAPDQVPSG